jgi:hypothetical protein
MDAVTGQLDIRAEGTSDKIRIWVDQIIVQEVYNPETGTTTPINYKLTPEQFAQVMDHFDAIVDLFLGFRAGNGANPEIYARPDLEQAPTDSGTPTMEQIAGLAGLPITATTQTSTCEDELRELETLNAEATEYIKKPVSTKPGEPGRLYTIDSVVSNVRDKIAAIRADGSPADDETLEAIENMHKTLQYYKDKSGTWKK